MSNDELEDNGLMVICKHCNSANIIEIELKIDGEITVQDACGHCGTVNYTKIVSEDEFEKLVEDE